MDLILGGPPRFEEFLQAGCQRELRQRRRRRVRRERRRRGTAAAAASPSSSAAWSLYITTLPLGSIRITPSRTEWSTDS